MVKQRDDVGPYMTRCHTLCIETGRDVTGAEEGDGVSGLKVAAQLSTVNAVSVQKPESTATRQDFR